MLPASWTTTAGSLSTNSGPATTLTAPSNATSTVTVTLSVADQTVTRDFSVVEPNGYTNASAVGYPDLFSISPAQAAAGMYLKVIIGPTNVSFYRVLLWRPVFREPTTLVIFRPVSTVRLRI